MPGLHVPTSVPASALRAAGEDAVRSLGGDDLARLLLEVEGILPGNGMQLPVAQVESILGSGRIVGAYGRPGGVAGLQAVAVEDAASGARLLAMHRSGSMHDLHVDRFAHEAADAFGIGDMVPPLVVAPDGSAALVHLIPENDLRRLGIERAGQLDEALATAVMAADDVQPSVALAEARLDRELAAAFDHVFRHADRHPGNALLDATRGHLRLVDNDRMGIATTMPAYRAPLQHPLLPGGTPVAAEAHWLGRSYRVTLSDDALDHLEEVDLDALRRAHERLAATPLPVTHVSEPMLPGARWVRDPGFAADADARLARLLEEGGWEYSWFV